MILHIPHASTQIPDQYRSLFAVSDAELEREIELMTDHETDRIFTLAAPTDTAAVIAQVSRLLVDVERFVDDAKEPMSQKGMGVIYNRTQEGKLLKRVTPEQRAELLDRYYYPHHAELTRLTKAAIDGSGIAMIVDCHSFPAKPLPYEDPSLLRPDVCIGADLFHTPGELLSSLEEVCRANGCSVAINQPFSGTMVPSLFWHKSKKVHSVMLEINRNIIATRAKKAEIVIALLLKAIFDYEESMSRTKVKILVAAKNDLYSGPEKIVVAEGDPVDSAPVFPAGTVGFVEAVFKHETDVMVAVYHNEDPELDARLGTVFVKRTAIKVVVSK